MATVAKSDRSTTITLASASAGPFDLDFRLFDDDGLAVYVNNLPRTDYTISSTYVDGYDDSATITFDASLAIADVIIIDSSLFPRRDDDYLNSSGLVAKFNIEMARIWATISDQHRDNSRSLRLLNSTHPIISTPSRLIGLGADGQPELYSIDPVFSAGDVVLYDSVASLLASSEISRGVGSIWHAGTFRYEEAASGATDHHLTTAGGVKLYETAARFTTEARLIQAVARGLTGEEGMTISAGPVDYVNTDVGGSLVWTKQATPDAALALAADAIPNTQHAVELTHLEQIASKTILGNPTNAAADPIAMTGSQAAAMIGSKLTLTAADGWSKETPTDGVTLIAKGGRATVLSGNTSVNVLFPVPFPVTRFSSPIVAVQSGAAEINVKTPDPYTVGGATEADGFTITVSEWDAATNLWVTPTADVILTWRAEGY